MTNWTPVTPLSDEPQDQGFWQPQQFAIGDRVQLVASGECPEHTSVSEVLNHVYGTVTAIDHDIENGHIYRVSIDRPELLPEPWMAAFGPWCAPTELRPLS